MIVRGFSLGSVLSIADRCLGLILIKFSSIAVAIIPLTVWAISARAVVRREAAGEARTMTAQPMAAPWVAREWAAG